MIMGFASGSEKELGISGIRSRHRRTRQPLEDVASAPIAQEARPRVLCREWCHARGRQVRQDAVRVSEEAVSF
jgi:hypothetical protein